MDDDPSDAIRPAHDVTGYGASRPERPRIDRDDDRPVRRRRRRRREPLAVEDSAAIIFIALGFVLCGLGLAMTPLSLFWLIAGGMIWFRILLLVFSGGVGLVCFGLLTIRQGFRMRADAQRMKQKPISMGDFRDGIP
jgi:hypothetical protein